MNPTQKFIASAIALLSLLTLPTGALFDTNPNDMHWPTKPNSATVAQSAPQGAAEITKYVSLTPDAQRW